MSKTKTINMRLDIDLEKTSKDLQNMVLHNEDDLCFFKIHTGSSNAWHQFIYSQGLIKTKQDFEKFKKINEDEAEN